MKVVENHHIAASIDELTKMTTTILATVQRQDAKLNEQAPFPSILYPHTLPGSAAALTGTAAAYDSAAALGRP